MEEKSRKGEYYMTPEEREETINRIIEKLEYLMQIQYVKESMAERRKGAKDND